MIKFCIIALFLAVAANPLVSQDIVGVKSRVEIECRRGEPFGKGSRRIIQSNTDRGADLTTYHGANGFIMARLELGFSGRDEVVEIVWKDRQVLRLVVTQKRFGLRDDGTRNFESPPKVTRIYTGYFSIEPDDPDVFEQVILAHSGFTLPKVDRASFEKLAELILALIDHKIEAIEVEEENEAVSLLRDY